MGLTVEAKGNLDTLQKRKNLNRVNYLLLSGVETGFSDWSCFAKEAF